MTDFAETMRARLRDELKAAMRSKEPRQVSLLRTLIGAIDNAQAIPAAAGQPYVANRFGEGDNEVPRLRLSEADVQAVLAGEAQARTEAAEALERHRETAKAAELREEAAWVGRYIGGGSST